MCAGPGVCALRVGQAQGPVRVQLPTGRQGLQDRLQAVRRRQNLRVKRQKIVQLFARRLKGTALNF